MDLRIAGKSEQMRSEQAKIRLMPDKHHAGKTVVSVEFFKRLFSAHPAAQPLGDNQFAPEMPRHDLRGFVCASYRTAQDQFRCNLMRLAESRDLVRLLNSLRRKPASIITRRLCVGVRMSEKEKVHYI